MEGSAPQTAATKEEQDYDTPDEETMDFFEELHLLARMGMRIMWKRNGKKLLSPEEKQQLSDEGSAHTKYITAEDDLARFQDMYKEDTCTVGKATIPESHGFVTHGIPMNILPKHMLVFTKGFKSKEHNEQWGVLEAYNLQRQRFQIFILKTEAEVWIKPENISITTDAAKEEW